MSYILPCFAIGCTVLTTLTALMFCMGMGANASPRQIRSLKRWMAGLSLIGVTGVASGAVLIYDGQPGWASIAAIAPTLVFALILLVALLKP